jgi:hypothetical protein
MKRVEESQMNQIINMFIRLVMRKVMSKGIDAGFSKAASMRGMGKRKQQPAGEIDDYGNPVNRSAPEGDGQARREIRAARRARREGRS